MDARGESWSAVSRSEVRGEANGPGPVLSSLWGNEVSKVRRSTN